MGKLSLDSRSLPLFSVVGIKLAPGDPKEVEVMLDVGDYEVSGHVLDSQGNPVPGAQASLYWSRYENDVTSISRRGTTTDGDGYFLFTQLGWDVHRLSVSAAGYRGAQVDVAATGFGAGTVVRLLGESP